MRLGTSLRSDRGCSEMRGVRCHMDELMQAWVQYAQCKGPNRAAVQRSEQTRRSTRMPAAARSTGKDGYIRIRWSVSNLVGHRRCQEGGCYPRFHLILCVHTVADAQVSSCEAPHSRC